MAARLFQKIIEDVIGSTSEDSSDEQSLRQRASSSRDRGTDRRRGRDGRSSGERSSSDRSDRRDRDGRRQQQQLRSSHGPGRSARRGRVIEEEDNTLLEEDESSYDDSSAEDEGSDWTSATSGTGLSSSVYDRHRRRQNHARVSDKDSRPSRRDRDWENRERERQREGERERERDQRQRETDRRRQREKEEAAEQRRIERERQVEREERHRERKLERELQERERERAERAAASSRGRRQGRPTSRLRRGHKQQQQSRTIRTITSDGASGTFSFSGSGSDDVNGVDDDDDDETGSLTRAVEDDLRRQKKMEQSRMAQATAKLEQMERHQHRLRYQVAQRQQLKRQLHEAAAAVASSSRNAERGSRQQQDVPDASYRQAELDHQRQKRERQESIEKLIENQGGQLVVPANTAAAGGHRRRHSAGRDDVSHLTLPSALEAIDDGSSAGNTGMASPVDGGGRGRGEVMRSIQEESGGQYQHARQHPQHQDRVDGVGGNGTGRHPWPCDPTAVDYAPKGGRAKTRSASVDEYVAAPTPADHPRKLQVARSFDVESSTYGKRPEGLTAHSSAQNGVGNARSFDNAYPSHLQHTRHYSGRGLYAVHERHDELPRPYQQNRPDNQDQQLIEEAQQILSPYFKKQEAAEGMPPPPPPPLPPPPPPPGPPPGYSYGPANPVHPQSQPSQDQYLHRTNPVSPIKTSSDVTGSVQNQVVVPWPSETEPMQPPPPQNRYPPQEVLAPSPAPVTPSPRNQRVELEQKQERWPSTPDSPTTKAAVVSPDHIPDKKGAASPADEVRKDTGVAPSSPRDIKRRSFSASPERRKGPKGQIRNTLSIDWTQTLWSPCDEDEEEEPRVFASPDYVPYWHRYINNGKDNGLSRRMREALHEMIALQNDNTSDQLVRHSSASQEDSTSVDLPTEKSTQLPRAVDTDVDSTTSNPTNSVASSGSGWQAPDPSMIGPSMIGANESAVISEDKRLAPPDPPSGPDARIDTYTDALVDPPTATSADNSFNQLAGADVQVVPPESSETEPANGSVLHGYEDEEGGEVLKKHTSDSDRIPLAAASIRDGGILAHTKDHVPHLEGGEENHLDQETSCAYEEGPGKIAAVPSIDPDNEENHLDREALCAYEEGPGKIAAVPSIDPDNEENHLDREALCAYEEGPGKIAAVPSIDPDNDECLEPGMIRAVSSVDSDGDDFENLHATLAVASVDSDGDMSALAKDILDVEPEAEPEQFEDEIMAYRETLDSDDPVGRRAADSIKAAAEAVVRAEDDVPGLSNTSVSAKTKDLAEYGAAVQIQRLVRGVQTRHRLLVQVGIC